MREKHTREHNLFLAQAHQVRARAPENAGITRVLGLSWPEPPLLSPVLHATLPCQSAAHGSHTRAVMLAVWFSSLICKMYIWTVNTCIEKGRYSFICTCIVGIFNICCGETHSCCAQYNPPEIIKCF